MKAHYGSFLERTTTDLECGTMDADKSILAVIEHRGDALDEREPAFFQSAVLYTTREGERRVRTCNLAVNVVRLAGSVFESAQVQSIAGCWAKQGMPGTQLALELTLIRSVCSHSANAKQDIEDNQG